MNARPYGAIARSILMVGLLILSVVERSMGEDADAIWYLGWAVFMLLISIGLVVDRIAAEVSVAVVNVNESSRNGGSPDA